MPVCILGRRTALPRIPKSLRQMSVLMRQEALEVLRPFLLVGSYSLMQDGFSDLSTRFAARLLRFMPNNFLFQHLFDEIRQTSVFRFRKTN